MDYLGRTKYGALTEEIEQKILDGTIKAGEKLLSEHSLAKKYEVSRDTVRKALSVLIERGYVVAKQGRGNFCVERINGESTKKIVLILSEKEEVGILHLIVGIQAIFSKHGYELLVEYTGNSTKEEKRIIQNALDKNIDGFIIEPSKSEIVCPHQKLYEVLNENQIPYVFLQSMYPGMEKQDCIKKNDYRGTMLAMRYLLKQGHKKIVGIFQSDDSRGFEQHRGYVKALYEAEIPYEPEYVIWFHEEDQEEKPCIGIQHLLERNLPLEAVICQNDKIARRIMNLLHSIGKKVPEHVSIIANDLIEGKEKNLTMISYHQEEIGENIANLLLNKIGKKTNSITEVVIQPKLIIGKTTKRRERR